MNAAALLRVLEAVATGRTTPESALARLSWLPIEEVGDLTPEETSSLRAAQLGEADAAPRREADAAAHPAAGRSRSSAPFARLDHHRAIRIGFPEVVFCEGKTTEQVLEICDRMAARGSGFLATRADGATRAALAEQFSASVVNHAGRVVHLPAEDGPDPATGVVAVVSAGTADLSVAEEAAATAIALGHETRRVYDVGVAGLHRLLRETEALRDADIVIVVAGMEGALPSVLGGLVGIPVVAVPTSVGYGAAFGGVAALLGMLNSCAAGVTVVNIDNGFGAACAASRIGRLLERRG